MLNNPNITKTHFGIYGILKQNGKILLIKKVRGPYKGLYDLPGGSPETGETKEETLKRELMEETSLKVKKYAFEGKGARPFPSCIKISFRFYCQL